jgi:hypothetical protein
MENIVEFPQKTKTRTAISSNSITAHKPKRKEMPERHLHSHVYCRTVLNSQYVELS